MNNIDLIMEQSDFNVYVVDTASDIVLARYIISDADIYKNDKYLKIVGDDDTQVLLPLETECCLEEENLVSFVVAEDLKIMLGWD